MRIVRFFIYCLGLAAFAVTVLGYFGSVHPAFDSLGHFRIHTAAATAAFGVLIMFIGGLLGGAALLVTGLLVLWTTLMPVSGEANAADTNGSVYRLLQSNLRFDNSTPDELLRLIAKTKPDVVTLQEVSRIWPEKLALMKQLYPYQLICPGTDRVGPVAIISRRPFVSGDAGQCLQGNDLAVQRIEFGGRQVAIAAVHLRWPWPHQQPRQVAGMLPDFAKLKPFDGGVLIAGDLNAATWSHTTQLIADASATSAVHYAGGSWAPLELPPAWTPYIGLPIDNVFSNSRIKVLSVQRQSSIGSDHLPVLIEFTLPEQSTTTEPEQATS